MFRIQYFRLINPLMTGGPINELNAGHGVDYCRIFMSGGGGGGGGLTRVTPTNKKISD